MEPAKYDLKCKAGTTFRKSFTFKDRNDNALDFTGYSARMHVRSSIDSDTILVALDSAYESDPPESGAWGIIEIDEPDGVLRLIVSDEVTSTFDSGSYVYDLEIVSSGGEVDSPLYGKFKVTGEVTR